MGRRGEMVRGRIPERALLADVCCEAIMGIPCMQFATQRDTKRKWENYNHGTIMDSARLWFVVKARSLALFFFLLAFVH